MSLASLRAVWRALAARPTLTAAVILTTAIAVGSASAIYSAVHAVLLTPLPFRAPGDLVVVWGTDLKKGAEAVELSHNDVAAIRDGAAVFESVAAVTAANIRVNLIGRGEAVQVEAALVTPGFFRTLGVAPQRGRDFGDEDAHDATGRAC
ncbi:MAG TPA: ABC transporter permease [Vicinamibacterales bacterium]